MACCCCFGGASEVDEAAQQRYQPFLDPADQPASSQQLSHEDFELLAVLGRGSYGKVMQARKRDTGKVYAMKVLAKRDVLARNQMRHALTERNLLEAVRHPFIVRLHFAFQSPSSLHLVMELQSGGELFFHLRREGAFAEARARLYAAEVMLALVALHGACFVYRDLKPENVLLDGEGHVRLSDFGLAKGSVVELDAGASTFCGTPSYMAPEVLLGSGHGLSVDWWSFGTLIYEMIAGAPPFYSRNLHTMYRDILVGELRWPGAISSRARALLTGLLHRDPRRRLHSPHAMQRMSFFSKLDFERVFRRGYPPLFRPTPVGASPSSQALDTANFDATFTDEDPMSEPPAAAAERSASGSEVASAAGGTERVGRGVMEADSQKSACATSSAAQANEQDPFPNWTPYFRE